MVRFQRVASLIIKHDDNGRILDVGCALGHPVSRFRSVGLKSFGCDISAWTTKKVKKTNSSLSTIRADALFLPVRSGLFDVTTAFETLGHCSNLDLVLNKIRKATESKSLVVVSFPATDLNDTYRDKPHIWHMSLKEWLDLFRSYSRVLSVDFFMKFTKYVNGKTCNTFIALRNEKDHAQV